MKITYLALHIGLCFHPFDAAWACRSMTSERYTFLEELTPAAQNKKVVAKVKILEVKSHERVVVEVFQAVKGAKLGEKIIVLYSANTCSRGDQFIKAGDERYISGDRNAKGEFSGVWSFEALHKK